MSTLNEGNLACTFPDSWKVTKYDDWEFYRNRFAGSCGGNKAVDFLAHDPLGRTLWLIELKDYRRFRRTKDDQLSLWDEVALKVRDTLAGLFAAKVDPAHPEQSYAALALRVTSLRVVLHLEQPATGSKLFPRAYHPADVQQKLKQMLKPIDAHPRVIELNNMRAVPWSAT
ncbi:MAG: hypothetical protein M1358_17460 [Chloroflexi bacterium]|nr:hypothetical protein [Chloroflexota bacterium]